MRFKVLFLALSLVVAPSALWADEAKNDTRVLTVLEPEVEHVSLDPAFEMVMAKVDKDLHYLLSSPFRLTPKGTALVGLTLITTLYLIDNDEKYLDDISGGSDDRYRKIYEPLQDLDRYLLEATAGIYLLGYIRDDRGMKSDALLGLESAGLSALFTGVPAFIIGRSAPEDSGGPEEYKPFKKLGSLPDVGSSIVFSIAGALSRGRGVAHSIFWYSLATGVGLSRVYGGDAWPSDVFLGAAIGTVIGRTVAGLSQENSEAGLTLAPVVTASSSAYGLGVRSEF